MNINNLGLKINSLPNLKNLNGDDFIIVERKISKGESLTGKITLNSLNSFFKRNESAFENENAIVTEVSGNVESPLFVDDKNSTDTVIPGAGAEVFITLRGYSFDVSTYISLRINFVVLNTENGLVLQDSYTSVVDSFGNINSLKENKNSFDYLRIETVLGSNNLRLFVKPSIDSKWILSLSVTELK